jgi:type III secretory pathway lipoprotein EscJ
MAEMAELDRHLAHLFTHSELSRVNQVIGMIWSVYPDDAELDEVINLLEAEGLSRQNRARLRAALKASRLVSQGKRKDSFRINPREAARLSETFAPVTGRLRRFLSMTRQH